jgi:replication factor C subunit 2/4
VDALIRCSEGDLRKAITYLQSAARLVGAVEVTNTKKTKAPDADSMDVDVDGDTLVGTSTPPVTVQIVEDIAGVIPDSTIDSLLAAVRPSKKSAGTGATYKPVAQVVEDLVADGWSAGQVVSQLFQSIVYDDTVSDVQKNRIMLVFSEVDKRLVDGADEHLSILDLSLRISAIMGER